MLSLSQRLIGAAAAIVAVSSVPVTVGAATATGSFQVTLTLQAECRLISASNVAFGTSGVIVAALTANGTLGVQCTSATPYNVGLGAGAGTGATVAVRKMTSGAGATVNYSLYRDAGLTLVWGNTIGTDTQTGTGTGALQNLTVYGSVPAQSTPAPGAYTDTVQVTVTY